MISNLRFSPTPGRFRNSFVWGWEAGKVESLSKLLLENRQGCIIHTLEGIFTSPASTDMLDLHILLRDSIAGCSNSTRSPFKSTSAAKMTLKSDKACNFIEAQHMSHGVQALRISFHQGNFNYANGISLAMARINMQQLHGNDGPN